MAVYNHWTGPVDWTGGLIEIIRKLVPMHELLVRGIYKCKYTMTLGTVAVDTGLSTHVPISKHLCLYTLN